MDCRPRRQEDSQTTGAFVLSVIKQFRANQGVLLAGAVAYYTLLSLVPLLILILVALSHVIPEDRLLMTLSEYLEFVVPGQSTAVVEEVRTFLAQKQVVGSVLFVTMLFFSALAFTILENAMSVIFYHRRQNQTTAIPGVRSDAISFYTFPWCRAPDSDRSFRNFAVRRNKKHYAFRPAALFGSGLNLSSLPCRSYRRVVAADSNLLRYAGGAIVFSACAYRWSNGDNPVGNDASHSRLVLYHNVANPTRLRFSHDSNSRAIKCRDWSFGFVSRSPGDRRV